jgi:hypothetical protein
MALGEDKKGLPVGDEMKSETRTSILNYTFVGLLLWLFCFVGVVTWHQASGSQVSDPWGSIFLLVGPILCLIIITDAGDLFER